MGTKTVEIWDGENLPPVGSLVLIRHGRDDDYHAVRVTGYDVRPVRGELKSTCRVMVDVKYPGDNGTNQREFGNVFPLTTLIPELGKTPGEGTGAGRLVFKDPRS